MRQISMTPSRSLKWTNVVVAALIVASGCDGPSSNVTTVPLAPPSKLPQVPKTMALSKVESALQNGGSPHDVVEAHNGLTRMHVAARDGDAEVLKYLISQGGDVNVEDSSGNGWRNKTPLHWASTGEVIDILIANGADQSWLDGAGKSPIASAAFRNRLSAVKRFTELGADVNARDEVVGHTILIWACTGLAAHFDDDPPFNDREERLKIVRFLVESGADVNGLSTYGETALHAAAKFDARFVRLLLDMGAKRDIKDNNGKTPLDWAKELGQQESVQILSLVESNNTAK